MSTVGWILLGVGLAVSAGVVFFLVIPVHRYLQALRRYTVEVRYAEKPHFDEATLSAALAVLPGATLETDQARPNRWVAEHPTVGRYRMMLRENEVEAEDGVPATRFDLILQVEGPEATTAAADAAAFEKLCRLAAVFARLGGVAVSAGYHPTALSQVTGLNEKVALVTPSLLEELAAGKSAAFAGLRPVETPTSLREFFEPAEAVEGSPRTFRLSGPRARGIACARHYFTSDVRFDWPRIAERVSSRGWRASVSEPRPGLMLVEFPELIVELQGEPRPAWVMFEVRGAEVDAPTSDPRLGVQFESHATQLPSKVWRFVLYDNNSGFPAALRLRLLSEVSRAMAEQHAPLMMAWDDAGHFIDPKSFHVDSDEALATSVVAVKVAKVNGAPADKACFVTTTGLSDLALPEVEFIASMERVDRFLPLLVDTAQALIHKGPIFNDGETVGHDASFEGRLRVLFARSLEDPKRFVMALQ